VGEGGSGGVGEGLGSSLPQAAKQIARRLKSILNCFIIQIFLAKVRKKCEWMRIFGFFLVTLPLKNRKQ
jgi:hypothetical protein